MNTKVPLLNNSNDFDSKLSTFIKNTDKLVLLLDYDGTLAPITTNPKFSFIDAKILECLQAFTRPPLNKFIYIGIISGRSVDDVKSKIGIENITYSGSHGLEIHFANGKQYTHQVSMEIQNNFTRMVKELNDSVIRINDGAWIENKHQSLTYHYQDVQRITTEADEQHDDELRNEVKYIIEKYGYVPNEIKQFRAIEARPPVKWNKGEAATYILHTEFGSENWRESKIKNYHVIFAGDDTTDEDAMRALKGNAAAISFRISQNENIQTYADYRLLSTEMVGKFLEWLLNRLINKNYNNATNIIDE